MEKRIPAFFSLTEAFLAGLFRAPDLEGVEEIPGGSADLDNGGVKCRRVVGCRLAKSGDLAHVLEGRRLDLLPGRRSRSVSKDLD